MANIAGVYDKEKNEKDKDDKQNKYYVGGADGRGGGSGLSVIGPPEEDDPYSGIKANATSGEEGGEGNGRVITLYSNGFTVDDGPFRSLTDPSNQAFIDAMNNGFVPDELRAKGASEDVDVRLVNKSGEEYKPPPPPTYVAYSGGGQSTGASAAQAGAVANAAAVAEAGVPTVDEALPVASVVVRLMSGKRLKARLNMNHTVNHLHALIHAAGAGEGEAYVLMAGFPPAQLTEGAQTIEAAGVAGSQVTQKKA